MALTSLGLGRDAWATDPPVLAGPVRPLGVEPLDLLPLFPGRRHPDFSDTIAFGDFTTDCRFLSCLAEIGLDVLITDLTMPGDGCARSDGVALKHTRAVRHLLRESTAGLRISHMMRLPEMRSGSVG